MSDKVRVGVVDIYPLFREAAVRAIGRAEGLVVAGEGERAEDAKRLARQCDVILLEPAVPGSLEATKWIVENSTTTKILFLSAIEDDEHAADALRLGVHGYLMKEISGTELVKAVKGVQAGIRQITPDLAWRLVRQHREVEHTSRKHSTLPVREQEVLSHVTSGLTNKQMARLLGLNISTIKRYKTRLFRRMGVRNRVQAIMFAGDAKKPKSS